MHGPKTGHPSALDTKSSFFIFIFEIILSSLFSAAIDVTTMYISISVFSLYIVMQSLPLVSVSYDVYTILQSGTT